MRFSNCVIPTYEEKKKKYMLSQHRNQVTCKLDDDGSLIECWINAYGILFFTIYSRCRNIFEKKKIRRRKKMKKNYARKTVEEKKNCHQSSETNWYRRFWIWIKAINYSKRCDGDGRLELLWFFFFSISLPLSLLFLMPEKPLRLGKLHQH